MAGQLGGVVVPARLAGHGLRNSLLQV